MGKNTVTGSGTNSQGNSYTTYSSGAYSYSNANGSSTFNNGAGHFYNGPAGSGYSSYNNTNTGTSWSRQK